MKLGSIILLTIILAGCIQYNPRITPPEVNKTVDDTNLPELVTMNVETARCEETGNTTIIISNTAPPGRTLKAGSIETSWPKGIASNKGKCPSEDLESGEITACVLIDFNQGDGAVAVYGKNTPSQTIAC